MKIMPIGRIRTKFPGKFGVPRQSGIVDTPGYIELYEPYDDSNALRGIEEFSHLWLIWLAADNLDENGAWKWRPTARPPRLGGNERKGIFATRSPFHPNLIGMSCVELDRVEGGRLYIRGADTVDGTPLLDIKPYIPYSDSIPFAKSGYAQGPEAGLLEVEWDDNALASFEGKAIPQEDFSIITRLIAQNPRPHYQADEDRVYGMCYSNYEIKFSVDCNRARILKVESLNPSRVL